MKEKIVKIMPLQLLPDLLFFHFGLDVGHPLALDDPLLLLLLGLLFLFLLPLRSLSLSEINTGLYIFFLSLAPFSFIFSYLSF